MRLPGAFGGQSPTRSARALVARLPWARAASRRSSGSIENSRASTRLRRASGRMRPMIRSPGDARGRSHGGNRVRQVHGLGDAGRAGGGGRRHRRRRPPGGGSRRPGPRRPGRPLRARAGGRPAGAGRASCSPIRRRWPTSTPSSTRRCGRRWAGGWPSCGPGTPTSSCWPSPCWWRRAAPTTWPAWSWSTAPRRSPSAAWSSNGGWTRPTSAAAWPPRRPASERIAAADVVIHNDGSLDDLESQVDETWDWIQSLLTGSGPNW